MSDPQRFIQRRTPNDDQFKNTKSVLQFIQKNTPTKSLPVIGAPTDYLKLPFQLQQSLMQSMATNIAVGMDPINASKAAVRTFEANWVQIDKNKTNDPASGNGWVKKSLAPPGISLIP